ncbi:hypothetical protein ID866_7722 [Astraeus odoratus]|nr:hypothetical protein ID866_7722 [Astraeus odoratus]
MMPPTTQAEYPGSGSGLVLMTPPACVPSQQPPSSAGLPTWNITPKYKDAGDAPFIFSPELAAASAAKLQAALQGNNYYTVDGVYSDAFPQQQPMVSPAQSYSYGACSLPPVASSSNASTAPILGGGSSSSLQGWAG